MAKRWWLTLIMTACLGAGIASAQLEETPWLPYNKSSGNKKWVSATAVADLGDSQAFVPKPPWPADVSPLHGIEISGGQFTFRGAGTAVVALGIRFRTSTWTAGPLTSAGAFTDDRLDAQDADLDDFPMHARADSGSGFAIAADGPFNVFSVVQSTAGDQTTPVMVYEYWDGAAWTAITTTLLTTDVLSTGTGEKLVLYPTPHNWVKGGSGANIPQHRYVLRVRQTNGGAGTTDPSAAQLFVGEALSIVLGMSANSQTGILRDLSGLRFSRYGEALFPIFSVPSAANFCQFDARYFLLMQ